MDTIHRISEVLFKKYGYYVPLKDIGFESYLFYREEIDEELVPAEVLVIQQNHFKQSQLTTQMPIVITM